MNILSSPGCLHVSSKIARQRCLARVASVPDLITHESAYSCLLPPSNANPRGLRNDCTHLNMPNSQQNNPPSMHHIRVLYQCFEGIASLKCLWFKATDEFTPVAQSGPSFSAEADILYTRWCLPKAVAFARTSAFILHDVPTPCTMCLLQWTCMFTHPWSQVLLDSSFRYF